MALPYTIYSILYQWQIAKQWCVFCCIVQGVLWLEFAAFLPYWKFPLPEINAQDLVVMISILSIPMLTWILFKPFLQRSSELLPARQHLHKFKYNDVFFNKLLTSEIKYTLLSEHDSLMIGNEKAEHVITVVSNPHCQPCAVTHRKLDEWLATRPDLKLQVVFALSDNENDPTTLVAKHLFSINADQNDQILKIAIDDWYARKQTGLEAWKKAHPTDNALLHDEIIAKHKEWCSLTEVKLTPTLFINGRKLPQNYLLEDIKYMI